MPVPGRLLSQGWIHCVSRTGANPSSRQDGHDCGSMLIESHISSIGPQSQGVQCLQFCLEKVYIFFSFLSLFAANHSHLLA